MDDYRTPLERAVDRANARFSDTALWAAMDAARTLAFEIIAIAGSDPRAGLYRVETLTAQMLQIVDDAFAEDRRQKEAR